MSDTHVGAELFVGGTRFPDTAAALLAGEPTALADVEIIWGRETTVDQPDVSTCRFVVQDRSGGAGLLDVLEVGKPVRLWATGNIAGTSEGGFNTMFDGNFETLPLGAPGERVYTWKVSTRTPVTQVVAGAPDGIGAQVLALSGEGVNDSVLIPPTYFDDGQADAWLTIPQYNTGQAWQITAQIKAGIGMSVQLRGRTFASPRQHQGQKYAGAGTTITGDNAWHHVLANCNGTVADVNVWLGLSVKVLAVSSWTTRPGTWAAAVGAWTDYDGVAVDRGTILAPAEALTRNALAFAGRISDMTVRTVDTAGTLEVEATAVDALADLSNNYIGDAPWPAEGLLNRVNRIYNAAGITGTIQMVADPPLDTYTVTWRDVDRQSTTALLTEIAAGIDFVLWGAAASTLPPYLWFENPALRAQVGVLEMGESGFVVIVVDETSNRPAGKTRLDGCLLPSGAVEWVRDVTDVLTRVEATWMEQTLDDLGNPAPTERTVQIIDSAAETGPDGHGTRRMGVATQTTTAAEATEIAQGVLARTRLLQWRTRGLEYDLGLIPPTQGAETGVALDLLDGTIRIGRGLVLTNVAYWPGGDSIGAYLDGGRYHYDGDWRLELSTTPDVGMGSSAAWNHLDAAWQWGEMHPTIDWLDLYGVAGPLGRRMTPIGAMN